RHWRHGLCASGRRNVRRGAGAVSDESCRHRRLGPRPLRRAHPAGWRPGHGLGRLDPLMPRITADGVELFYESLGEGTPFVLQAHDHSPWMFFQVPYFSQFYRVITFDRRGTGRSACPPGPWAMADFARDMRALLDALN